jgi:murein L,D-transpeptidase YcbB/YkuD
MMMTTAGSLRAGILPAIFALALLGSLAFGPRAFAAEATDPAMDVPSSTQAAKPSVKPDTATAAKVPEPLAPMPAEPASKTAAVAVPAMGADTTKSTDATKPAEAAKPVEAAKAADVVKPVEAANAVGPPKPADTAKPAEVAKAAEAAPAVGPPKPVEMAKGADAPKPADTAKAAPAAGATVPEPVKPADAKPDPAAAPAATGAKTPDATTAALPATQAAAPATGVADAVLPPADPIVADVRTKAAQGGGKGDDAALVAFYNSLNGPAIWVSTSGLTHKGKAVIKEFERADDWGLRSSDFPAPTVGASLTPEAAADAEIKISQLVLKYARYARGGRINPANISQLMDVSLTLIEPKRVLADVSMLDAPDAYLRSLHPKHVQFELLRQALLKARGKTEKQQEEEAAPEDPALAVKLPPGKVIKPGGKDPQIVLLRQRLKVAADDTAKEDVYDDKLVVAVRDFQKANGVNANGVIANATRAALNGQQAPTPPSSDDRVERILINMERWRWLPEDLGKFYVWDNVPEALTRVVKDGKIIHTDRIIVGQPTWPTPFFSADMKTVVFHPTWGVPDGIKAKELAPILRKSSGGGLFGVFGGGYSAEAVLEAYQLRAYVNGRPVDANSIDWSSVDMRSVSFQQPPGPKNPLGDVKFLFPNKHDVYMHDTPERDLFSRPFRALSHGCMRIQDPRKFAEIILGEDKGWSPDKVRGMFNTGSSDVPLSQHIPVHVTYMTMRVDENGKLQTFGDFYGLDSRTASALNGKSLRYEGPAIPQGDDVTASADDPEASPLSAGGSQKKGRNKKQGGPPTLADAISGLFDP